MRLHDIFIFILEKHNDCKQDPVVIEAEFENLSHLVVREYECYPLNL